jgi:imidazole glycerol-phosphate synthase subunit HisF
MLKVRIIPCLDIVKNKVVKGVNFKNIKVLGDPVYLARKYSDNGADELCMLDIKASHEKRKTFLKTVEAIAKVIDIPLTVGGGVSDIKDITTLLNAGADKVSINTTAVLKPNLIKIASLKHGSQCIVVAIDGKRYGKKMLVTIKGGRERINKTVVSWAKNVQNLGAGELLVTSMDTDGIQTGFDKEMLIAINKAVNIPVIASGGVGELKHFKEGYKTRSTGLLAASVFHTSKFSIQQVKKFLNQEGVPVRI